MTGADGVSPVERVLAVATGAERDVLDAFCDFYREAVVRKVADLGEDDARRHLVGSSTTLAGLVKHLRIVEINWFQRHLARIPEAELPLAVDWSDEASSFVLDREETVAGVVAAYREQCALSRGIAAGFALEDVVPHDELGEVSLRWILVHLIDETARHAGHADILRELVDGRVGAW